MKLETIINLDLNDVVGKPVTKDDVIIGVITQYDKNTGKSTIKIKSEYVNEIIKYI